MTDDPMDSDALDPELAAELAALVDGSLPSARAAALRARIATTPDLAQALAAQRAAFAALRAFDPGPAPARLHEAVAAMAADARGDAEPAARPRPPWFRRRPFPAAATAGALAAGIVVLAIAVGPSGTADPTAADAARVALLPTGGPPPPARPGSRDLNVTIDGVSYPYWGDGTGWRPAGTRTDTVQGRKVRTVVYVDSDGRRLGYTIVAGSPLPIVGGGRTVVRNGVRMRLGQTGGTTTVTWLRQGHTCILVARGVSPDVLLGLAGGDWA